MNHKKFILLLNSYVDGEATPDEASALHAEIRANPRHRDIYHDYCRLQRATEVHFRQFHATENNHTPPRLRALDATGDAATGRRTVGPFRTARVWLGGGVAAACVATAFLVASFTRIEETDRPSPTTESASLANPAAAPESTAALLTASPSIAAPLLTETRVDPYLIPALTAASDPFAFRGALNSPDPAAPISNPDYPEIVPVSGLNLSGAPARPHRTAPAIFKSRVEGEPRATTVRAVPSTP